MDDFVSNLRLKAYRRCPDGVLYHDDGVQYSSGQNHCTITSAGSQSKLAWDRITYLLTRRTDGHLGTRVCTRTAPACSICWLFSSEHLVIDVKTEYKWFRAESRRKTPPGFRSDTNVIYPSGPGLTARVLRYLASGVHFYTEVSRMKTI